MLLHTPFDGPIDRGIEHVADSVVRDAATRRTDGRAAITAEATAHALLRVVGDRPGTMGRVRAARVLGGYAVPCRDDAEVAELARYGVETGWTVRELVEFVDAALEGGLLAQTVGQRPVLVLTRAGFQALSALEAMPPGGR